MYDKRYNWVRQDLPGTLTAAHPTFFCGALRFVFVQTIAHTTISVRPAGGCLSKAVRVFFFSRISQLLVYLIIDVH